MSTKEVTGYLKGKPFKMLVTSVDGVDLEVATAQAYRRMQTSARVDGIELEPTSGFRSNQRQTAIWIERQDPAIRALKGGAARPGFSEHQSGRAVDIRTGITFQAFNQGSRSPVYTWLEKHAAEHGFYRTIKSEPWHWEFWPNGLGVL